MRRSWLVVVALLGAACSNGSSSESSPGSTNPIPPTSPAPTTTSTTTTSVPKQTPTTTAPAPDLARVRLTLTSVVSGLRRPVALAWRARDPNMFVAEQGGRVRLVTNGQLSPTPVLTVGPLSRGNEEGLLGITFSPDGSKLYVDYTDPNDDTHVDEYTMRGEVADTSTRRQILVVEQPFSNHKGGEVLTGVDGMLYIGLGDGGSEDDPNRYGQNRATLLSKILRINPAKSGASPYSVPADNPFIGQANVRPETWMWGLRNPWRFSFDRKTGDLWIGDVGQNKYEEIDFARSTEKGINWGWRAREGFHAFRGAAASATRDPLLETAHANGNCAIVGGYVYRGRAIAALDGVYVFSDNCRTALVGVVASGGRVVAQRDLGPRVSELTSFGEDPAGELYAVARGGTVFRITSG